MNAKASELKREYQRQWRAKNKERVKEYNRKHWEKKAMVAQREAADGRGN